MLSEPFKSDNLAAPPAISAATTKPATVSVGRAMTSPLANNAVAVWMPSGVKRSNAKLDNAKNLGRRYSIWARCA